jgi:hypothetical protein
MSSHPTDDTPALVEQLAQAIAENYDRIFPRDATLPPRLELAL